MDNVRGDPYDVPTLLAVLDALSLSSIGLLTFDYIARAGEHDVTLEAKLHALWGKREPLDVQHFCLSDDHYARDGITEHLRFFEQKMLRPGCLQSLKIACDSWRAAEQVFAFLRTCGGKDFEYLDLDIIQLVQMEGAASGYRSVVNAFVPQLMK